MGFINFFNSSGNFPQSFLAGWALAPAPSKTPLNIPQCETIVTPQTARRGAVTNTFTRMSICDEEVKKEWAFMFPGKPFTTFTISAREPNLIWKAQRFCRCEKAGRVFDSAIFYTAPEIIPEPEPEPVPPEPEQLPPEIITPPDPLPILDPIPELVIMNPTNETQVTEAPIQNMNDNNFAEAFVPLNLTKAENGLDIPSPALEDIPPGLPVAIEAVQKGQEDKGAGLGVLLGLLLLAGGS